MKNIIFSKFLFIAALFFVANSFAQERIIQGQVFTFDSIPLINAQVKVKSTKQIVMSDRLGNFSVDCKAKDVLIVSANGFRNQKIKLKADIEKLKVNMKLKPGDKNIEIAVIQGHIIDKNQLIIASNTNKDSFDYSSYKDMIQVINGRFPDIQIINDEIILQGVRVEIFMIDGMVSNFDELTSIPPIQVKSVEIVKGTNLSSVSSINSPRFLVVKTKRGENN